MKALRALPLLLSLASPAFAQGFDVNDTVFLFPLDAANRSYPALPLARAQGEDRLIEDAHFQAILKFAKDRGVKAPLGAAMDNASDWSVVGFRYDPCSPDTRGPKESECLQELRLVAQPFANVGPADSALHIIYDLGHGEPKADDPVLADLVKLKDDLARQSQVTTAGRALGVHPALKATAPGRAEAAQTLVSFVKKYATPARLKKLTMMGLKNGSESSWTFLGGDIVNGQWEVQGIANLPSGDDGLAVELDLNSTDRVFFPVPLEPLVSTYGFFHRETLVDGELEELRESLHTLENPELSNRNTSDCLSCHSATTMRLHANTRAPGFVEGKSMPLPVGITGFPEARLLQRHRLHWNLRSLGYFSTQPTLSMRTVNEAALVADRLNRILSLNNPGPDCSGVERLVLSCFENATPNPAIPALQIEQDCLKQCRQAAGTVIEPQPEPKPETFALKSAYSQKCLEPQRGREGNGTVLRQYSCGGDAQARQNFRWIDGADASGQKRLQHVASGLCLDISGPSVENAALLHLWSCHAGSSQRLQSEDSGAGLRIRLEHSNKCVDISGPSRDDNTPMHQWSCHGGESQVWTTEP